MWQFWPMLWAQLQIGELKLEISTRTMKVYVKTRTNAILTPINSYLMFDGTLSTLSAYNAAKNLAFDTTFDGGGIYTCVWMNNNYEHFQPQFSLLDTCWRIAQSCSKRVTDVLHTLYISSNAQPTPTPTPTRPYSYRNRNRPYSNQ